MEDTSYSRLRWQCRRGMLELDHILQEYLDQQYQSMSLDKKTQFALLLENADQTLLEWCLGNESPPAQSDNKMVQEIRNMSV
ncbi:MAG: succinate dehydrogenase assembly factor 2 [Methylococcales bacterium]|jgi:antitoxin CptB|nr:succinate dehydrogenase assembly factor 2 [Methylococcales bacterium]MBT7444933.1 succinate dehydrogenase assembly factor 2 [Methylococcales bacterium]